MARRRTRQAAGITAAASMMLGTPGTALAQDTSHEAARDGAVESPHTEESDELAELITQLREDSSPDLDPLFDALEEMLL